MSTSVASVSSSMASSSTTATTTTTTSTSMSTTTTATTATTTTTTTTAMTVEVYTTIATPESSVLVGNKEIESPSHESSSSAIRPTTLTDVDSDAPRQARTQPEKTPQTPAPQPQTADKINSTQSQQSIQPVTPSNLYHFSMTFIVALILGVGLIIVLIFYVVYYKSLEEQSMDVPFPPFSSPKDPSFKVYGRPSLGQPYENNIMKPNSEIERADFYSDPSTKPQYHIRRDFTETDELSHEMDAFYQLHNQLAQLPPLTPPPLAHLANMTPITLTYSATELHSASTLRKYSKSFSVYSAFYQPSVAPLQIQTPAVCGPANNQRQIRSSRGPVDSQDDQITELDFTKPSPYSPRFPTQVLYEN
jgi:hypothetical protein